MGRPESGRVLARFRFELLQQFLLLLGSGLLAFLDCFFDTGGLALNCRADFSLQLCCLLAGLLGELDHPILEFNTLLAKLLACFFAGLRRQQQGNGSAYQAAKHYTGQKL